MQIQIMDGDLISFLVGIGILVMYLIFSAQTEMFTKFPWQKNQK
ncbi:MAG: hypothetical protein ACRC2R_14465 [Xenococcaceae cyanobacterium]